MENTNLQTKSNKKIKLDFKESKYATGRRKTSVARIWLKKGSGNIYVNGVKMLDYFKRPVHQNIIKRELTQPNRRTKITRFSVSNNMPICSTEHSNAVHQRRRPKTFRFTTPFSF